jgi:hypothetical protein
MIITLLGYICFISLCLFVLSMCIGYTNMGSTDMWSKKFARNVAIISSLIAVVSFIIIAYLINNQ